MRSHTPIDTTRIRTITGSFSWLDHRLLADGHLDTMTAEEMRLYFFLVLVGDKNGISFYGYDRICVIIKMNVEQLIPARDSLENKSLIAFDNGRYQVLQLPGRSIKRRSVDHRSSCGDMMSLKAIFRNVGQSTDASCDHQ